MNRYQRRKRALKRKEAKAELLLSRAIIRKQQIVKEALKDARLRASLLSQEGLTAQERTILSFRKSEPKCRGLRSNCSQWPNGYSARGANGKGIKVEGMSDRELNKLQSKFGKPALDK
jgi:hypothetical protein